MEEVIIITLFF